VRSKFLKQNGKNRSTGACFPLLGRVACKIMLYIELFKIPQEAPVFLTQVIRVVPKD
jgi:hypothetical protein